MTDAGAGRASCRAGIGLIPSIDRLATAPYIVVVGVVKPKPTGDRSTLLEPGTRSLAQDRTGRVMFVAA